MGWFNGEWYEDGSTNLDIKDWCPECDPAGIPEPYVLRLCPAHVPSLDGSADVTARGQSGAFWASGSSDVEASTNARWCELLHGRVPNKS